VLAAAGQESFDQPSGQLRVELCLGVLQMYPLDEDGSTERRMSAALEQAATIQAAVRKVLDGMDFAGVKEEEVRRQQQRANAG
jgi:hypothetical protein